MHSNCTLFICFHIIYFPGLFATTMHLGTLLECGICQARDKAHLISLPVFLSVSTAKGAVVYTAATNT